MIAELLDKLWGGPRRNIDPFDPGDLPHLIHKHAQMHGLDPLLVAAVILQESTNPETGYPDPWATRFEEKWWERHLKDKVRHQLAGFVSGGVSLYDEKIWRATSYGYMQILGETARSILKFDGTYLTELIDPDLNISLGCALLKKLLDKHGGNVVEALKDWNGSTDYPPLVLNHISKGKAQKLLCDEDFLHFT